MAEIRGRVVRVSDSFAGLLAYNRKLVAPSAGGAAGKVLASGVRRVDYLLVRRVLNRTSRASVDNFEVQAV